MMGEKKKVHYGSVAEGRGERKKGGGGRVSVTRGKKYAALAADPPHRDTIRGKRKGKTPALDRTEGPHRVDKQGTSRRKKKKKGKRQKANSAQGYG